MSKETKEALTDIDDWYASLFGTYIWMYNVKKSSHVVPNFSLDKLIMQEVSYHISVGLTNRLHRKKKASWPALPLHIRLYELWSFKHTDVEAQQMKKYPFNLQIYNPSDPYCLVKDHCLRLQFN